MCQMSSLAGNSAALLQLIADFKNFTLKQPFIQQTESLLGCNTLADQQFHFSCLFELSTSTAVAQIAVISRQATNEPTFHSLTMNEFIGTLHKWQQNVD
jgi:hypothetical protein